MPSLHKRPRSPYWVASFQDAHGRWLKKSTKTGDKALAQKLAVEWGQAAREGRKGRFVEAQARRVFSEIAEQATGSPLHFHTCQAWMDEFLAGKVGAVAESTHKKYRQVATDFLAHLGPRARLPLPTISIADVRSFRDALKAEGLSASTVNQTIRKSLTAPFEAAKRLGYIAVNPCAAVELLKDDGDTERDAFTIEQVERLLQVAAGDWKGVILCGYYTGLRLMDIARLTWDCADFASPGNPIFRVRMKKKNGKPIEIPILPPLQQWLAVQPAAIGKAPVFPSLYGKKANGRAGLSNTFTRDIMEAADIRGRVLRAASQEGKGRTTRSLSFHSLRHSFNTHLANAGISQEIRQRLVGHASAAMNDRYTHLEHETLRRAMEKLPHVG